jgi:Bor protein
VKAARIGLLAVLTAASFSCASPARTVYINLHPVVGASANEPSPVVRSNPRDWRNFFLFGWVPGVLVVDAADECGGAEHVERIEAQQSFVQRLIARFARSTLINVYSPYTGRVVCDFHAARD